MPHKISKTLRPVLGSYVLMIVLLSASLMALDKDECYSILIKSAPLSSSSDLNIKSAPSFCELMTFETTKSIRCGCYKTLLEAKSELEDILPMRQNSKIIKTKTNKFKNQDIVTAADSKNLVSIQNTPELENNTSSPIKAGVLATSTSALIIKDDVPQGKSLDNNASDLSKTGDQDTSSSLLSGTAVLGTSVSLSQNATDIDLEGFSQEGDIAGFNEENEDLAGFDAEDDDLSGFAEDEEPDGVSEDDDLDGFGDDDVDVKVEGPFIEQRPSATQNLIGESKLSGRISLKVTDGIQNHSVNGIEYSGINQAQVGLYLQWDKHLGKNWKIRISGDAYYDAVYNIYDNDYSEDILDAYKTQLRFDDTYILGSVTENLDAKIGRQVVVWGKSDNIRITDVINPTDNRLPGVTDIEYIRLPVGMAKFDYYVGNFNISMMLIGESRVSISPPVGSEFLPLDTDDFAGGTIPPGISIPTIPTSSSSNVIEPDSSIKNTQAAVAINGIFSGWDLSLYGARVFDKSPHSEVVIDDSTTDLGDFIYNRIWMTGAAANMAYGAWIFKSEVAFLSGLGYSTTLESKKRFDALVGIEYFGMKNTSMSLEFANRHIFSYEDVMGDPPDSVEENSAQTIVRVTRNFFHEKLELTALVNLYGIKGEEGGFSRLWGEYELGDAFSLTLGFVLYRGGSDAYFNSIKDNDRVFSDISYSF